MLPIKEMNEGLAAYNQGLAVSTNPYKDYRPTLDHDYEIETSHDLWNRGWYHGVLLAKKVS